MSRFFPRRFNLSHSQSGHLFQGRYKSILVENDAYLMQLSYYIHNDPLRAGMVMRLIDYRWRSYPAYAYNRRHPDRLDKNLILSQIHGKNKHQHYREKSQKYSDEHRRIREDIRRGVIYGSQKFVKRIKDRFSHVFPRLVVFRPESSSRSRESSFSGLTWQRPFIHMSKYHGRPLIAGLLIFFLIIAGCANQVKTGQIGDEIPIEGAVYSVHRSDGSQKTYIDVVIGRQFPGRLPDDIDSITVSGPQGDLSIGKDDFNYNPQWRGFWYVRPGNPEIGTYTFRVTGGKRSGLAKDVQSNVKKIPLPDTNTFFPARGAAVTCTPPVFSWHKLNDDRPLFYQVEIRDENRQHVYRTNYARDMESVRLPPDIINSGKTYQWRVRVADGADWLALNNRSQSRWVTFSTPNTLKSCKYSYHPPLRIDGSWETSSLDAQEVDPQKIRELMHQILKNNLKNIHSILLIKNGKLILEEYFHGYHRNLKHSVQSVTKSVTSILLGIARDQGQKIEPHDKLIAYLPEYNELLSKGAKSEITLEHLLTMRAGLEWNELHVPSSLQHMYESSDAIEYVLERKLIDPPGQRFFYSTGLSTVLGKILKNTTGFDADQFAEAHLFTPLGITDYGWGKLSDGTVLTGSHLYLRPRDMAKLGYLFLKGGAWKGEQIVSKQWVRESIYPHVTGDLISGTGYGYQWWRGTTKIDDQDIDAFYMAGHGGQFIVQIPSLDVITVITSEYKDNNAGDFRAYSVLENYIIPAVLQTDPVIKIPPFKADSYRRITGKYRWPKAKLNLKIFIENGKIYAETILFDGKFELLPLKKGRFLCISEDVGNFWLDIMEDSNKNIEGVKLIIGFSNLAFKRIRGLFGGI